jgi:hypothetical protein
VNVALKRTDSHGRKALVATVHLVITGGHVHATDSAQSYTASESNRLSIGSALKLAKRLGIESEVREELATQAHAEIQRADQARAQSIESYAATLDRTAKADAHAARVLAALDEVAP